jgi:hypothetical protein
MITAQTPIDSDPVHQMLSTRALHVLIIGQAIPTVGDLAAVDRATAAKWRQCGAVTLAEFDNRKHLSAHCERAVAEGLSAALAGRQPPPARILGRPFP